MSYKIKIVYDFPPYGLKKLFFRDKWILPHDNLSLTEIKSIMGQFDYVKKVNIVVRNITEIQKKRLIFESLCKRELSLEELREFVIKLKRDGFSSNSIVSFIDSECKPNKYIYQIKFDTGRLFYGSAGKKLESTYKSHTIYDETKTEAKTESKNKKEFKGKIKTVHKDEESKTIKAKVKLQKCNGCGGIGVGLVKNNGFCDHCNRTTKYGCSVCNKFFSTDIGRNLHLKMKHPQCETCGSFKIKQGIFEAKNLCQYCIDDVITYK